MHRLDRVTEAACTDAKHRSFPTQVVVSTEGGPQYRGCRIAR
jgi:hypothetical protein